MSQKSSAASGATKRGERNKLLHAWNKNVSEKISEDIVLFISSDQWHGYHETY